MLEGAKYPGCSRVSCCKQPVNIFLFQFTASKVCFVQINKWFPIVNRQPLDRKFSNEFPISSSFLWILASVFRMLLENFPVCFFHVSLSTLRFNFSLAVSLHCITLHYLSESSPCFYLFREFYIRILFYR